MMTRLIVQLQRDVNAELAKLPLGGTYSVSKEERAENLATLDRIIARVQRERKEFLPPKSDFYF